MVSPLLRLLRRIYLLFLVGTLSLALFACNNRPSLPTPVVSPGSTPTSLPTATALPPSPTPQPDLVILFAPPGADSTSVSGLQSLLEGLSGKSGLRFQVRTALSPQEMQQARIVVALPPANGLAEQIAAYPRASFLALGFSGLQPAANLTILNSQALRPDQLGFLAGYTAAIITTDWRVAVLTAAGGENAKALRQGFTNGVFYFCGLCRPVYPPFPTTGYPITIEIPAGNSAADQDAAITMLQSWQVGTAFVDPALSDEKFVSALAEAGINLILAGPPPAGARAHWVASLGASDPLQAVQALWPDLLKGNNSSSVAGGTGLDTVLGITDSNPELLSPGRKNRVEEMLKDLLGGYIDTGVGQGG